MPTTSNSGVGLRAARIQAGMTQVVLVSNMLDPAGHVTAITLSHWENGRRVPSPAHLLLWLRQIHPTPKDLLEILLQLSRHPSRTGKNYARFLASSAGLSEIERVEAFYEWANA